MAYRETVTIDDAIALLNEALRLDPNAMNALIDARVVCNSALAEHPTIQVDGRTEAPRVGILGVLNGLFGVREDGWGPITAMVDEGHVTGFQRSPDPSKERIS